LILYSLRMRHTSPRSSPMSTAITFFRGDVRDFQLHQLVQFAVEMVIPVESRKGIVIHEQRMAVGQNRIMSPSLTVLLRQAGLPVPGVMGPTKEGN